MIHYPKAFIFDLDGVITDTAEFHYIAWKTLGEELGVTVDRVFNEQLKGISRMESLERIITLNVNLSKMSEQDKQTYASKKNEHYKRLIEEITPGYILPTIKPLLNEIKSRGIKIALGSASKNASTVIERLGIAGYFDYVVDAAKITNGKPDPEIFTTAADALGVSYSDCIGIEDADAGVLAINQARMFSVGVGCKVQAAYTVANTDELDFQTIITMYSDWKKVNR